MSQKGDVVLDIKNLSIELPKGADRKHAVEDVSLTLRRGEILCVVGESGSGKSVMTSAIMNDVPGLLKVTKGEVLFDGVDVLQMTDEELNEMRGARISMIYQEPMASLNPAMKIGKQLIEVPMIHEGLSEAEAWKVARQVVEDVRLPDPDRILQAYPHQLSGGQQQRLVIARAIAVNPEVILMDEPCSALDPIATARIEELIDELRENYCIIIVTHSMQQAARVSQQTAFFHLGELVEVGPTETIFTNPRDQRTQDYIMGRFG